MLKYLRVASLLEGTSFLVILSVALNFISRDHVFQIGMTHGTLFLAYFVLSLVASHKQAWPVFVWLMILLAGFIPFAFIAVEAFLRKQQRSSEARA